MLNITLIDATGGYTFTQLAVPVDNGNVQCLGEVFQPAIDWMEGKMHVAANSNPERVPPPIAAFIYNTETKTLIKYSIDGLRARIVK
jgi:hypothetical protein